ncbi:hypothetical protein K438DRAFT_1934500 [Mycena galopus ATCC 62051]|nr:hypothetical protein K438DRAFT_1934500 [Mycena galopus ATCC 62051]
MPSPLRKTASRKALAAENDELRNLLKAAGIELDKNVAQMALMQRENANIRQQLHAKKNKQKRSYTTGQARLMTGDEMHAALLKELQKKQMGELHSELKKKIFPAIRKDISEAEKFAKAAKKQREREAKAAQKEMERVAKAAARARGRGRGRATRDRGRGRGRGAIAGRGRGRARARDSDGEDESADEETGPSAASSDEDSDADEAFMGADNDPSSNNALSTVQDESDGDSESGEEETGIDSFNGHRWESRRNLQFQVLWTDGDVTWEPLSNVNDCAAMENYLAHRDVDDPLRLSKRKFLINTTLKAILYCICGLARDEERAKNGQKERLIESALLEEGAIFLVDRVQALPVVLSERNEIFENARETGSQDPSSAWRELYERELVEVLNNSVADAGVMLEARRQCQSARQIC